MPTPSEQYIPWLDQVERERDELRAEVERLRAALEAHHSARVYFDNVWRCAGCGQVEYAEVPGNAKEPL